MMEHAPSQCPNCKRLERKVAELEQQVEKLSALLEESRRAGKRQAAPFRKKTAQPAPKKPGRKPGRDYGAHQRRAVPETVEETYEAPLPECCPDCRGTRLGERTVERQYQVELPRKPIHRQFNVHRGRCQDCGRSVQGRHELQTSDALGAAAVTLGPDAQAAMALLNKDYGLSHGKVAGVFQKLFGLRIARSTSVRSVLRTGQRLKPAYVEIRRAVREADAISPDETGWRVAAKNAWLHGFATAQATCYVIDPRRSADPLADLIGRDWTGLLIHDGWAPYDQFSKAGHQQCLRHLLNRAGDLLETARGGAVRFPRAVNDILGRALDARDRSLAGEIGDHGRLVLRGRLVEELRRLVEPVKTHPGNERLAAFLDSHLEDVFTFLAGPGLDATNWRAEQALRPAVVNRKVWGGNRTWRGARAQAILMSVLRTCHQRSLDALEFISRTLRCPRPLPLPAVGR